MMLYNAKMMLDQCSTIILTANQCNATILIVNQRSAIIWIVDQCGAIIWTADQCNEKQILCGPSIFRLKYSHN